VGGVRGGDGRDRRGDASPKLGEVDEGGSRGGHDCRGGGAGSRGTKEGRVLGCQLMRLDTAGRKDRRSASELQVQRNN
jgi:hypothetical protein